MANLTVPFNIDAERAVLGSCLLERETILVVRNLVATDEFYLEKHAQIYSAILACLEQRQPPDLVTVSAQLRQVNNLELVGGMSFLAELLGETPTAVHAEHYARIVRKAARKRRLIELGGQITAAGYSDALDPDDVLDEAELRLNLERSAAASPEDWQGRMSDGADIWKKHYTPRPFVVEGILPAGITLLHGLPKTNKSWFGQGLSYAVAGGGKALGHLQADRGEVLYLNLEMDEELLNERLKVMFPSEPPARGVKFFYEWPTIDNGFFSRLDNYVSARPYTKLIIVDTLVRVMPLETKDGYRADARLIEPFTRFNANRGLAILLIHHSRKLSGGNDPIMGASGSTGITGSVDGILELVKNPDDRSKGKLTRTGRRIKDETPLNLKWDAQLGNWSINNRAGEITPERRAVLTVVEERGPITPAKIAVVLDRPQPSIRRICQEMQAAGQLSNMQGAYALPYDESQIA
jgi:hypothetical protein